MLTKHPILDRIVFAFCLSGTWILPSVFVWIALFRASHLSWVFPTMLLVCSALMYVIAYIMTFPVGGLRYVMTGSDI